MFPNPFFFRLPQHRQAGALIRRKVMMSVGTARGLARLLHRDWPGEWSFHTEEEATLRGLAVLPAYATGSRSMSE